MYCHCCGGRIESSGGCARCNPRTYCACGAIVACGCGRSAPHDCSTVKPATVTWPIPKIVLEIA